MTTIQNTTNNQDGQDLDSQLADLLEEAKKVNREIDETNKNAEAEMDQLDAAVEASASKVDQLCADLDQAEKEAGEELDKLMLRQAEDLASE